MHYDGGSVGCQRYVHYFKDISGCLSEKRTIVQERYCKDKIPSEDPYVIDGS
jgi:hypothetical protein